MTTRADLTYEQAFEELETIVSRLASGTLPLNETVALYTRGRELTTYCQSLLDNAELQISKLDDQGRLARMA